MPTRLSHLLGLNGKPPPAVFWRKNAKQFMSYIGFHIARKGKAKGLRVRTAHYLGTDQREANLNAILIDPGGSNLGASRRVICWCYLTDGEHPQRAEKNPPSLANRRTGETPE